MFGVRMACRQLVDVFNKVAKENERLKAENAELQTKLFLIEASARSASNYVDVLESKNEKLTMLVSALSSSLNVEQAWCSGDCEKILGCKDDSDCVVMKLMDEFEIEV